MKLSRLTSATRLYRGMGGLRMPDTFTSPDQFNIAGGTEVQPWIEAPTSPGPGRPPSYILLQRILAVDQTLGSSDS